ncbi:MAG: AMP-binding protein [Alphaproteobacteria bacterium]|nr:AMP-binding protein [Alphaproteobacteria bacterium]
MMVAHGTADRLGLAAGDRWTSIIPLFHCAGCIMNLLGCLQFGAAYVGVLSFDAEAMLKGIEAERCTFLSGVPTSYLAMRDHPARQDYDLTSLRAGTCGGADCDPALLQSCATEFPIAGLAQVYGQTEGGTIFAAPRHDDPRRWDTVGKALPGYDIRIVDPLSLAPLAAGEIGEIQARGPMVMEGYYDRPLETAEVLLADGWLRTGDLGYLDGDGYLVIAGGRLRDMIIRGGENIYPAEIENVLCQHGAVKAAAVFGEADPYYGEVVAAALRLDGGASAAELKAHCAARIAHFKVPARLYAIEAYPLTPSGKVRKVELRKLAAEGRLAALS